VNERRRQQDGAAVVLGLGMFAVLVFVAAVTVGAVAIVLGHRQAQAAADLASLAGAGALQRGADPCAAAQVIAGRQHAVVTACVVEGESVLVTTAVRLPSALGSHELPARARAGPADQLEPVGAGP